jgi:hypothetical protein
LGDLQADQIAWESRATKLTRELSRTLKALAEIERREGIKKREEPELELLDEEPDLVQRTLSFARSLGHGT